MKQQIFKLLILTFISLIITNCEKGDDTFIEKTMESTTLSNGFRISKINKQKVLENKTLTTKFQKFEKSKETQSSNKTVYSSEHGFSFNTDYAKYVEDQDGVYHSYTFKINKEEDSGLLENLLFSLQPNGDYDIFIVTYNITEIEQEQINNGEAVDLEGKVAFTLIDGADLINNTFNKFTMNCYYHVEESCACNNSDHAGGWDGYGPCPCYTSQTTGGCSNSSDGVGDYNTGPNGNDPNSDGTSSGTPNGTTTDPTNPNVTSPAVTQTWQKVDLCLGQDDNTGYTPAMQSWLQTLLKGKINPIYDFLLENSCSVEAKELMTSVIATLISNPNDDFEDAVWENVNLFPETIGGDIITDIVDYLDCFDLSQPAELTVYIDQPKANSDTPYRITYNPLDMVDVGHTFIAIKQGGITRVLGYYPIPGTINPSNDPTENVISCTSLLRDDSGHPFDVSISTNITSTQLNNIYNSAISSDPTYNLNTYNCTDFGIEIGNQSNMTIPNTNGTWPRGGNGSNPGNLGQDIRNMATPAGATKNTNGGTSSSNSGSC